MEEQALARKEPGALAMPSWEEMRQQAAVLVKSGFLPRHLDTAEKVLAVMLTGRELGVPPMAAIRGLYVVDGKATANAQLMLALVRRSGMLEQFDVEDGADRCAVTIKRHGESAISVTWTDEDTKRAGLNTGFAWPKYPRIMRRWRAITEALRVAFSDVLAGIYTPDELGVPYKVEGEDLVIDMEQTAPPKPAATPAKSKANGGPPKSGYLKPDPPVDWIDFDPAEESDPRQEPLADTTGEIRDETGLSPEEVSEEKADLRDKFTQIVRRKNWDIAEVRARFAARYGCQPEAATIDMLLQAIEKMENGKGAEKR